MPATEVTPYLFFSGRCEEALEFYRASLGGQIEMIMRFSDSPEPVPAGMLQEGFENKVMHASFAFRGVRLFASDGCNDQGKIEGFQLAMSVPTEGEAHEVFDALSQGGTVRMPLVKTFWSPCYGMLTDKFNVEWMVMVPGQ